MPDVPLIMPKMSMTMSEGEVIGWRKQAGDHVAAGEVVCEVLTDKVDMEVEAPVDGILDRIVAAANATVPVGEPIAFIRTESDNLLAGLLDSPTDTPPTPSTSPPAPDAAAATGDAGATPTTSDAEPSEATAADITMEPAGGAGAALPTPPSRRGPKPALPGARRRAGELGVRLDDLNGTGPSGAISLADVERAAAQPAPATEPAVTPPAPPTPTPETPTPAATTSAAATSTTAPAATNPPAAPPAAGSGVDPGFADALTARRRSVRAAVARAMTASAAVPQFTVFRTLDLTALEHARATITVGWTTLLVRAFARVLREHPELNAVWTADGPQPQPDIGVALAVDTPVGLLAPVLPAPDRAAPAELDSQLRRLAERARAGRLRPSDLDGATTTVSNLGGLGVESFQALLTPPQATILSLGRIGPQPRVMPGGGIAARTSCTVGLTVDHRAADGADAARLLADLAELTGAPDRLLAGG
jgi:pyruvate dehydrogenase E2 component (dihydrolipoamide acetyltransferase)